MMTIYNPGRVVKVPVMPPILWESVSRQNVSRYRRHHHTVARSSADTHPVAVCTETSLEMSAVTHESFESAVFSRKTNRESALISYQHHASLFHTTDLTVTLPFICGFFFVTLLQFSCRMWHTVPSGIIGTLQMWYFDLKSRTLS